MVFRFIDVQGGLEDTALCRAEMESLYLPRRRPFFSWFCQGDKFFVGGLS